MKNLVTVFFVLALTLTLSGCVASKPDKKAIVAEAFGQSEFILADIPSHGFIGDSLIIAAGGGSNATGLQKAMLAMNAQGGEQYIAITSSNSLLAKTVLENALKDLPPNTLPHLHIAFLGDTEHGDALRTSVARTGARFQMLPL